MRGKLQETATNESSSSKFDTQIVPQNPYEQVSHVNNTNIDQQEHIKYASVALQEPPPSYHAAVQSSIRVEQPKSILENNLQHPSLNNQTTPFPPDHQWPRFSTNAVCPHCGASAHTRVETFSTIITFSIAIILFLLCCCLFIIPFCVPTFKRTIHYCSNCHSVLGEVREFH